MRHKYGHIALALASLLAFAGCGEDENVAVLTSPGQVAVNMSRAAGEANDNYRLMFWKGGALTPATPLQHSFGNSSEIDTYKYDGGEDYPVFDIDGTPWVYPQDDSPIYAVGYYPSDSIVMASDWKSFTLGNFVFKDKEHSLVGLADVVSTEVEEGRQSAPFINYADKELQYRHTQVKLVFRYKRTLNLNARIAEIWVTIPKRHIANKWTLGTQGYVAEHADDVASGDAIFSSTKDWYDAVGNNFHTMNYSVFNDPNDLHDYETSPYENCYVLPNTDLFSMVDGQAHITFDLDAMIMSSDISVPNKRLDGKVTIPLIDEDGNKWTTEVKAGDAFTIDIIFEQNRLVLMAYKMKWVRGGYMTIPLNPNAPNVETIQ